MTSTTQVARYILSFSWIYHGLFPKLLYIAPLEAAMTATLGFSAQESLLITRTAGVVEIVFGVTLFMFYKVRLMVWANVGALVVLLAFVAVQLPGVLVEAFNPVTTNLALLGLSYVLLHERDESAG